MAHWTDKIDSVFQVLLIDVKGRKTKIQGKGFMIEQTFEETLTPGSITELIDTHKGKTPYRITSDIIEIDDEVIHLNNRGHDLLLNLLKGVLVSVMPFFHTIIKQENTPVLIVSSVTKDHSKMTVSAGLVEDTQVILLDVKREESED